MSENEFIKHVKNTFSLYGFLITREVSTYVVRQLLQINSPDRNKCLLKITEHLTNSNLLDPHISIEQIKKVLKECFRPQNARQETETIFNVINACDIPKITYNVEKKKFVLDNPNTDLYSDAVNKPQLFCDRLELLKNITKRQEKFSAKKFGETDVIKHELTPTEFLLSNLKNGRVYVIGILSQLTEGQFYIEDTGGAVKLDLKKANFGPGLFTEGSIVLLKGIFEDKILTVEEIDLPPAESSQKSQVHFGVVNTFGGAHKTSLRQSEKLREYEQNHVTNMIVILSDMWLDNGDVLAKLRTILDGFAEDPPTAFVFCGHFLSFPPNVSSVQKLKEGFESLAGMIKDYPDILEHSQFVFVPGPHDLGAPKILPRGPLPKTLLRSFLEAVPGAIFASNPCRIQYCTKEIVVCREDILTKMCRNTIRYPEDGNISEHYAKSIVCQAHLAPMSLPVVPVYWRQDHALQLYPTPDLIIAADQFQPFTTVFNDCNIINPGSFRKNGFSFKVYRPGSNEVEECEVPAED